jgi:D-serine deaminase-like pyridoxal phosphate-dependent protein
MRGYSIGMHVEDIDTPALCLDIDAVESNIKRMADYFRGSPVRLRPHAKTHKCPMLGHMQLAAGAIGLTCAKLSEAEVMVSSGIKDILIANQVVGQAKIARLVNLAAHSQVMVAVDDATNVTDLNAAAEAKGVSLRVLVELNIGMNRCGVAPGRPALELARQIASSPGLRLEGVMGYEGHVVFDTDVDKRRKMAEESLGLLTNTADLFRREGLPVGIVSCGATGTYFISGNYPGVTELQVGSYITMDSQYRQEVGIDFEYALTVLSTVVSAHPDGRTFVDAGLKTVTRDFGLPLVIDPPGWQVVALSEEHGHLKRMGGPPLKPGDKVTIVPNHGCTTINLHDNYHVVRQGILEAVWPISARGKTY